MKRPNSIIWIATALLAVALTAGCNKKDDSTSTSDAGKKIDQAQERAGEKMDQAKTEVKEQTAEAGAKVDDATITAKVKTALVGEPGLKEALRINVDTANGVVTLSGAVDSPMKVDRATQVAQAIEGVKSVDNRLTVKQG